MPSSNDNSTTVGRVPMLQWVGGIGAATAEALAHRERTAVGSARGRLAAAAREGLLSRQRPLVAQPALYTLTPAGIRASGLGLQRCRVSAANALHLIVCAGPGAENRPKTATPNGLVVFDNVCRCLTATSLSNPWSRRIAL